MLSSMENFKIKEQIGKGAQATVYIVERLEDKKLFILKKVECFDESEANKAFKEAEALKDLQHVYVSGYREFFVLWEQQDSSVFICILMDYFPKGTLETVLAKYREKSEVIDEEQIKQWLGQIIEALIYVHKKNIIHRDVRPSNIYLQEDDTLSVGDFGVNTIMGDAVTCTRATEASMYYMAPEVRAEGYTEKSDVWSLGCVLFELVTAWMYSSKEAIGKLKEIRENPNVLDEIFEDIAKHYSDALITVLGCMLKVTSKQRQTATGLMSNKYIKTCVEMSDSTQLEKRKRLKSASTAKSEIVNPSNDDHSRWPVPKGQGVMKVLEYLASMVDYENCVRDALSYLLELAKSDEGLSLDQRGKKLVAMAMKNNMTDLQIQVSGFNVLNSLVMNAENSDVVFNPEVLAVIPLAMENHKESVDVQLSASALLVTLAANGAAGDVIGHLGGVQDLLAALRNHASDAKLCSVCLSALWGLTVHGNNVKIATEEKGIKEVCNVLKVHMNSAEVAEAACAAMLALSLDEENLSLICDLDAVGLLISAISTHSKSNKVVKNACLALASLVEVDEESAYRVLTNEGPNKTHIAGIPIVMKTYELHKDNAEVVESIATLLMELAEYEEICSDLESFKVQDPIEEMTKKFAMNMLKDIEITEEKDDLKAEMNHLNIGPGLLSEIFKRFKENVDIMGPCETALERLRNVKKPEIPPTPSPDLRETPTVTASA